MASKYRPLIEALKHMACSSLTVVEREVTEERKEFLRKELEDVALDLVPMLTRMFEGRGATHQEALGLAVTAVLTIAASCVTGVENAGRGAQ